MGYYSKDFGTTQRRKQRRGMTGRKETRPVDPRGEEELKERLLTLAAKRKVDFRLTVSRWSLWRRASRTTPDNIDFVNNAASLGELFTLIAQKQSYVFQMLEDVLILEAEGNGQFNVQEYSYAKR